jgi:hypothetical protein
MPIIDALTVDNAALRARVEELERDVAGWRTQAATERQERNLWGLMEAAEVAALRAQVVEGDRLLDIVTRERQTLEADNARLREQVIRALCPDCNPSHVLANGRVWGLCATWHVIPAIPEVTIRAWILALAASGGGAGGV